MNSDALFGMALGLQAPWTVTDVSFKADEPTGRELHLRIGFASGSKFKDDTGAQCSVHDTGERQWQHLNFFEHHCFLHCKIPRIKTSDGRVRNVDVPWARAGSGFNSCVSEVCQHRKKPLVGDHSLCGVEHYECDS